MKYIISNGEVATITKQSKVLLVDEFQEKYPGYLEISELFETTIVVFTGKKIKGDVRDTAVFSPQYIKDVSGGKDIEKEDLRPLVRDLLREMLPALIENAVKDAVKDKLTPQFFNDVAATTVKATVQTEVAKALKVGAKAIDPKA